MMPCGAMDLVSRALGLEAWQSAHKLAGSHFLSMETSPFGGRREETVTQSSRLQKLKKLQDSRDLL